ncbi:uncharacterized protein LOC62_02G002885 [Vanrija pseudolonga]|uniref:Uncharacterized protein n=1 Tax=Vanrija pseudolonga TaxID=143232 RepID=A0AAF1BG86_9TREE|nr:hypothetical protein LOC62_02G002885 [Vanrija pseudolonga]
MSALKRCVSGTTAELTPRPAAALAALICAVLSGALSAWAGWKASQVHRSADSTPGVMEIPASAVLGVACFVYLWAMGAIASRARHAHPLLFAFTAFFGPAGAIYTIVLAAMNLVHRRDRVLWDTCVSELGNKTETAECDREWHNLWRPLTIAAIAAAGLLIVLTAYVLAYLRHINAVHAAKRRTENWIEKDALRRDAGIGRLVITHHVPSPSYTETSLPISPASTAHLNPHPASPSPSATPYTPYSQQRYIPHSRSQMSGVSASLSGHHGPAYAPSETVTYYDDFSETMHSESGDARALDERLAGGAGGMRSPPLPVVDVDREFQEYMSASGHSRSYSRGTTATGYYSASAHSGYYSDEAEPRTSKVGRAF